MDANPVVYVNTHLQYHLGIDPDTLTDEEWAEKYAQLADIRQKEADANKLE